MVRSVRGEGPSVVVSALTSPVIVYGRTASVIVILMTDGLHQDGAASFQSVLGSAFADRNSSRAAKQNGHVGAELHQLLS